MKAVTEQTLHEGLCFEDKFLGFRATLDFAQLKGSVKEPNILEEEEEDFNWK